MIRQREQQEVEKIIQKILDIIYPPVCGICGKLDENWICNKCKIQFNKHYNFKIDNYKNDKTKNFDEHIYFFKYDGIVREELIKYKFQEKSYNYKMFSEIIFSNPKVSEVLKKYDIVISVPVSRRRKMERGYNQSELIAKDICKKLNKKYSRDILIKTKNTTAQSTLNKEQRKENAKGVYEIRKQDKIKGKKVLLIDDIYTTGSTVNECSRALKQANPKEIGVATVAKDQKKTNKQKIKILNNNSN